MGKLKLFKTVQWKVVVIYMLLLLMAMQVIGAYFTREVEKYYTNNFSEGLNGQATLLSTLLEKYFSQPRSPDDHNGQDVKTDIDNLIRNMSFKEAHVQVVDANGTVISTSEDNPAIIGQRTAQKEITIALLGTRNESMRIDPVTEGRVKVLAVPIKKGNVVYGAVYMVASIESLYTTIRQTTNIFATGTFIALVVTAVLGYLLAQTITKPVKEMTRQAKAVANGDFNRSVHIYSDDEIGQLGSTFNYMTARLKEAVLLEEEEREKLSQILANMSDGVMATDRDGTIILMNRSAEEMLEVKEADVLEQKRSIYDVLRLPPEEEMPLFQEVEPLLLEMMVSNREVIMLRVLITPLQQDSGKKGGIIAVLQDVTEQERTEQQRRNFVANVSHELRTPLTTIKSYTEALMDGAVEVPELSNQFLRVTMNETDRMIRLVNDLLQLTRFDAQGIQLNRKRISMTELLQYATQRFTMQCEQNGIKLTLSHTEGLDDVYMDDDAITQVLDNLLSNAIKYTPEGGEVTVEARADNEQQRAYISVKDTGIGIPKRDLRFIFERFYRVDKARSRSQGGTGLGLAIAKDLVEAHGGEIQISSEWNEGTIVTFWIPLAKGGEEA
ncbi:PAS domain-containing sensor histidine kinase [Brevibacillus halotolerans]|uniref:cell wall metabolism sensor histidine kinase WalK n=1 Tax=Brevibacillus halotolerans TaxID=1507437 RepID=UPI001B071FD5|nr:cell wall metabolism sensor histidine kinase WalK [Brevibacillus halotolerans]GIO03531.1 PAS domain-containing sensor histidine kinase [Brevibacillus halotolerans]